MVIHNIIFDIDGVLVNLDHAYWLYLKTFPQFKAIGFNDMAQIFPIDPKRHIQPDAR